MGSNHTRRSRGSQPGPIRNVLANWGAFLFGAAVTFVLSPFIVHTLGDTAYGAWVLLGSLVGYLGLLDLGVRGAVTRYVARHRAAAEHVDASQIASAGLFLFCASGVLAVLISLGLALPIAKIFVIPPGFETTARVVLVLGGLNIAVSLVSGVFGGIVTGLERFDLNGALEIGLTIVRTALIVLALSHGFGLVALAIIQLACSLGRGAVSVWLSRRLYPELRLGLWNWQREQVRQIFSYSIASFLLNLSGMLILYSDSVVIGAFLPIGMVTFFTIAATLTDYARSLTSGIAQTVAPRVSAIEGTGGDSHQIALASGRIASLVILPIALTFILRGESFIRLWMGEAYAPLSGQVLRLLSLALWFSAGRQILVATMMGLNRHRGLVPAYAAEAVCNIALSILLIPRFGLVGVAVGTVIPNLVMSLSFVPWYSVRVLGGSVPHLLAQVWLRPSLAMIPFALGTLFVERWWPAAGLFLYFAQVAAVLPLAILGAWFLGLAPPERARALTALPQLSRRSSPQADSV